MTGRLSLCVLTCWLGLNAIPLPAAEPRRLTETRQLKFSPAFINEGREIVFVELTDPTLYRLQRLEVATGKISPLHPEANTPEFEPGWAADGKCYAYLKTKGVLSIGIMIHDQDGTLIGEIAPEQGLFGYRAPAAAPNKSRIAFTYAAEGTQQIYSCQVNGEDKQALTNSKGLNHWPAYSPDGSRITFGSSRDGNFEIYVMNADGSDPLRLTDQPLQDIRPRFSPDGRQIVFTSHRDGNAEIYVMQADGSQPRRITNHLERDDYADWHPSGKQFVTVSERQGRHELWLWDVPSSE